MAGGTTRQQIIDAADQLFYRQGYEYTSFADIAEAVRISRGNFYHHFKTKDDILGAVIAQRMADTAAMLRQWDVEETEPLRRIGRFVGILATNRTKIMHFGCPVGTLSTELAKLDHDARPGAVAIFTLFRNWLSRQFVLLGLGEEADALSMHILARSQGIATLANAFHDEAFIRTEIDLLHRWLQAQAARGNPSR